MKPEEPPPSPVPSAGYLGLTERSIDVDWKSVREHGPSVIVPPFSPAWRSGLRSGDFIKSINGHSYDDFHASIPIVGTRFEIVAWRPGFGEFTARGELRQAPKLRSPSSQTRLPTTPCGRPVAKKERPVFHGYISKHRNLTARDTRLLSRLLDYDGPNGIFPRRGRLAHELQCSLSTLDRSIRRSCQQGVLRVESGKSRHTSNRYVVTWPEDHSRSAANNDTRQQ